MVYFIEEGFQIYIYDILRAIVDVVLCFYNCLVHALVWSEPSDSELMNTTKNNQEVNNP